MTPSDHPSTSGGTNNPPDVDPKGCLQASNGLFAIIMGICWFTGKFENPEAFFGNYWVIGLLVLWLVVDLLLLLMFLGQKKN